MISSLDNQKPRASRGFQSYRNHRGQALTEAAMVLPVLVILTLGIVEVARAFLYANLITHAAREGARAAAVSGNASRDHDTGLIQNSAAIRALVQDYIEDTVHDATVNVSVTQRMSNGIPLVDVTVNGQFATIFSLLGDSFAINRTVTFRDEGRRGDGGAGGSP